MLEHVIKWLQSLFDVIILVMIIFRCLILLDEDSILSEKSCFLYKIIRMNDNDEPIEKNYNLENVQPQKQEQADPVNSLNPITLLKKPDQFKEAFFSMTTISVQAFKAKNYERAILALTKCIDMLDLGKNILKEINRYWKIVIYGNLACCYHYTRKLSKCNKFCQKIKEELEKLMLQSMQKELYLKINRMLIKLKFQHCAILSQLEFHEKAFELCKSTVPMLIKGIEIILAYVVQNSASDVLQKKSSQTVQFSRQVYKFAQGILNDLLKCLNQPFHTKQRNAFYYWQKNPEQNQQQVKKKFITSSDQNHAKRSILGVSKSSHWIDQFNIGTIMHFSEMNINDFQDNIPMEEYLFKDRLYELVIYCSMAHFTMATELRLIQSTQQEKNDLKTSAQSANINLMKKYGYEQKSQTFKLSEMYHLRSIDIMAKNIKTTVPYLTHIIRSYEKHYIKQKKVLEKITAIVQESALSLNQSKDEKHEKEEEPYYSVNQKYYFNKPYENVLEQRQHQITEPCPELLLESQTYNTKHLHKRPSQEITNEKVKNERNFQAKEVIEDVPMKKLTSVRSADHLGMTYNKQIELNEKEDLNNSGQYLKSQRHNNKSGNKFKVSKSRQKSHSKNMVSKPVMIQSRQLKKQKQVKQKQKNGKKVQAKGDGRTERPSEKGKQKQKKAIKKQKFTQFQNQKYGEKQIKIKTQSCTHIKVFYKKKK